MGHRLWGFSNFRGSGVGFKKFIMNIFWLFFTVEIYVTIGKEKKKTRTLAFFLSVCTFLTDILHIYIISSEIFEIFENFQLL
jgi:hypothetical protein